MCVVERVGIILTYALISFPEKRKKKGRIDRFYQKKKCKKSKKSQNLVNVMHRRNGNGEMISLVGANIRKSTTT